MKIHTATLVQARLRVILDDDGHVILRVDAPGCSIAIALEARKALELADALTNGAFSILFGDDSDDDGASAAEQEEA